MPARKQRWEPMLNMAGKPVLDPTHVDRHPHATFEASPGYNERRYNGPVHRSADTIAEAEADPESRTGYGVIPLDRVEPQGMLFRARPYNGGFGPARSARVDAALNMAGTVGAASERKRKPTPDEQREWEETGRVGEGIVHGKGEGKYGYTRSYYDDRPTELRHVVEGYNAKPSPAIVDAIKRSDVPPEHLLGINRLQFGAMGSSHTAGYYKESDRSITMGKGHARSDYLAHEVGHHVDNMRHGTIPYFSGSQIGRSEGEADAYEAMHVDHAHEYSPSSLSRLVTERTGLGNGVEAADEYVRARNRYGGVSPDSEWHDIARSVAKTDALPKPTGMWVDHAAGSATAAARGQIVHQWVPGDEQGRFF